jgi:hypothetical protein
MSRYQRPWWLIVNKPAGLVTTVKEETTPGGRVFIIHGEPLVQGLAWLTWGPAAALIVVLLLAGLALGINVKAQVTAIRGLMVVAFLGLPALVWVVTTLIVARLSQKHLQAERQAETQECIIRLEQNQGALFFQTAARPAEKKLAYDDIRQAKVTHALGSQIGKAVRLTLETKSGPIILLDEALGTQAQKIDLAYEIQKALKDYSAK